VGAELYATAVDLIYQQPEPQMIAIDIPIGLTEAGPRQCDKEARQLLGWPRRNSVFTTPIRPALHASARGVASEITLSLDGRKVGMQSWGIYDKIAEVDAVLIGNVNLQGRVREVHPELSFWAWNGGQPMAHNKKSQLGRNERRRLIDEFFGKHAAQQVRSKFPVRDVGHDDINDAFAGLWTAKRIVAEEANSLPAQPPFDTAGLRMEIWC